MPREGPAAVCPGCGCAVDPLRAGRVAILDGRFEYFCGSECRRTFAVASGKAHEEELATVEPPAVVPRLAVEDGAPLPARSPPVFAIGVEEPRALVGRHTLLFVLDVSGVVSGVLGALAALLGDAAEVAAAPLAVGSWMSLAARTWHVGGEPADPHPGVIILPTALATAAAVWAKWVLDPRAAAIAELAALACAVFIVIDTLVRRDRAGVTAARTRIEDALDVRVHAIQAGEPVDLHSSEVRPGEDVVVETGEIVGVDAVVSRGEARVVPWLGADFEMVRREGDPIVAGAKVLSKRLLITTTWSGRERAWVKLLSNARTRVDVAAPTVRALRQTVEWGTPIAGILAGVAAFASNASPVQVCASMAAGAIAVASKAAPSFVALVFARAHLRALKSGIIYRDAAAFERAGAAEMAVFSARGTILLGEPEIVAVEPVGPALRVSEREVSERDERAALVLSLAAGAETGSNHPFAKAILRAASARGIAADHVRNAKVHAGLGVSAIASTGERLVVGGRAIMLAEKIGGAAAQARLVEWETQGRSVLLVALGDRLVGLIALQDGLRPRARAAVQKLLDSGIEPVLLSGEARDTCETIGRALDIEHVRPEVLRADRRAEVLALGEGGSVVAVVGHAIRDDGALGAADVAIALDAAGATPGEWAVVLASDDVARAAEALAIPRAARRRRRVIALMGFAPAIFALLATGFGVAPLALAPVAALLASLAMAASSRASAEDFALP